MNTVILDVRTLKDSLADPNNQTLGNPQSYDRMRRSIYP